MHKIVTFLLVALCIGTVAEAKKQTKGGDLIVVSEEDLDGSIMSYVEANVLATMYHELAHALIDLTPLPVYGREEDAADTFVVVITDMLFDEKQAEQITWASADQYARDADEAAKKGWEPPVWDSHSLDLQRYYNLICLYYGGDVKNRRKFATSHELPDDRAESCEDERSLAEKSWGAVLAGMKNVSGRGDWITIEEKIDTLGNSYVLAAHNVIREEVARLNERFSADFKVTVEIANCNQENAFYTMGDGIITMCNELARSYVHK